MHQPQALLLFCPLRFGCSIDCTERAPPHYLPLPPPKPAQLSLLCFLCSPIENSYEGALASCYLGTDFVEVNVQLTSDKALVLSLDPYLSRITNIKDHPEFANRKRTYQGQDDW